MAQESVQYLPYKHVIIIGAGFAGLDMACELKRKLNFHDFVVYERNQALGGTWYDNDYPGCAVDIPGFTYQLSFAPETQFSHIFPNRQEMLSYMERVAEEYDIYVHIQLNTSWTSGVWLEDRQLWRVELRDTITNQIMIQECKVLIGAIGHQVDPKPFEVPGKEKFGGKIVPACKYPVGLNLRGKDVVVLGNGSTAVQVVPNILTDVRRCTQVQRAPQWILNRPNPFLPVGFRSFIRRFPFLFYCLQCLTFLIVESFYPVIGWLIPSIAKRHLRVCQVPEKYHPLITPSYTPGCKRIVFAPEYLQCLKSPKVELVQDKIVSMTENSVNMQSGKRYPCDVLILCHGFKADTFYYPLKGRGGLTPQQHWDIAGGPSCYKGCAMNGFPNFFSIRGPNVSSGHQSLIHFIESTTALIINVAAPLIQGKVEVVEVDFNAELSWVRRVQAACRRGFWGRDCHTFYVTEKGWNHTVYPWTPYWLYFHRFVVKKHWMVTPAQVKT